MRCFGKKKVFDKILVGGPQFLQIFHRGLCSTKD